MSVANIEFIPDKLKPILTLFIEAAKIWSRYRASRMAAALAYYTLLSLAPLLVIAVAVAGVFYGPSVARSELIAQISDFVGEDVAQTVRELILNTSQPSSGIWASAISLAVLLFAASAVLAQLKETLNVIWQVPYSQRSGLRHTLMTRLISFGMVLSIGFLLLASLVLSTVIAFVNSLIEDTMFGYARTLPVIDLVSSVIIMTLLFALIFRVLPDRNVAWGDVWWGALLTAVLFTLGKFLISLYVGSSSTIPIYGAASSIVVLLIWVYFLAQILFYGAAFAKAYADHYGSLKEIVTRDQ